MPFTVEPLNQIQWQADSVEAKEQIKGSIPLKFVTDNAQVENILKYIAYRKNLPEIDTYITKDQVATGFH
jgi:hypothetical protein